MRNLVFYFICALIAAMPAFAAGKKTESVSDDAIAKARAAAAAEDSILLDDSSQTLTVNESATGETTAATTTEAAAEETAKQLSQEEIKSMKESEIPLVGAKQSKKSESSPWFRLIATVGVIGGLFVAATYGIKKYGKRSNNTKAATTKIRVVTQHHLGPKKSLMIVNVAGESLLLGVTDHNINILKNLSLLDEELPADVPKTFAGAINDTFIDTTTAPLAAAQAEEDDFAVQGLAQIKDKVSSRLKNMRQI